MINNAFIIGIEGTHSAGKTTLALALTATLRESGIHAIYIDEAGRHSPLIEDVVINQKSGFTIETELDLFASQVTALMRSTRHCSVAIADKTVYNVIGYAQAIPWNSSRDAAIIKGMIALAAKLSFLYDRVFYLSDQFKPMTEDDPFRVTNFSTQEVGATAIESACRNAGLPLTYVPPGLSTVERVSWCLRQMDWPGGKDPHALRQQIEVVNDAELDG